MDAHRSGNPGLACGSALHPNRQSTSTSHHKSPPSPAVIFSPLFSLLSTLLRPRRLRRPSQKLEQQLEKFDSVNHEEHAEAPEDHLAINLRAALIKVHEYYSKLDETSAYYAATILHPRYKLFCDTVWAEKPEWLLLNNRNFNALWAEYKTLPKPRLRP